MNPDTHAYFANLRADLARQQVQEHRRQQDTNRVFYLRLLIGLSIILGLVVSLGLRGCDTLKPAEAAETITTQSSWYNIDSTIREGTCTDAAHRRCLMANGKELDDAQTTCASWDFPFGTTLTLKSATGRTTRCVVSDRGPARRLYHRGRRLDVSYATAQALGIVKQGIGTVEITEVK